MTGTILALVGVTAGTAVVAMWLTGRVRDWVVARGVLDLPNARSLHTAPVPRGGGFAIVVSVLPCYAAAAVFDVRTAIGGALFTVALAGLGALDDRYSLRARTRFLVQVLCAVGLILVLPVGAAAANGWEAALVTVLGTLAIVWLVNLYNFMDGSDGIAATQAVVAALCGGGICARTGLVGPALLAAATAGAAAGFLRWNWAPARIFLGDVGSYFLGAQFALLAWATAHAGVTPWFWVILLAPFVVDASLTLARRMLRGDAWASAHRTHAYQLLVRSGWSHAQVARALAALGIGLWPLAWLSALRPSAGLFCAVLTYGLVASLWGAVVAPRRGLL